MMGQYPNHVLDLVPLPSLERVIDDGEAIANHVDSPTSK